MLSPKHTEASVGVAHVNSSHRVAVQLLLSPGAWVPSWFPLVSFSRARLLYHLLNPNFSGINFGRSSGIVRNLPGDRAAGQHSRRGSVKTTPVRPMLVWEADALSPIILRTGYAFLWPRSIVFLFF